MSDRGRRFRGIAQAFDYNVLEGFLMRYEWRGAAIFRISRHS